jgi:hypothetical protein
LLESFLNLLQGKPADRIVWTADITYWMAGQKQAGAALPAWDTEEGYLQLHRQLGILPYYYYDKFWIGLPRYGAGITFSQEDIGGQTINRFETPAGALTEISVYLPGSCTVGCTKHYVENEQDLDVLLYILEHRQMQPANLAGYPDRMRAWAQYGGLPSLGLPRSPLPSFIYEWAGLQQAAYLLADCKGKVTALLRLMEEQEAPVLEALCRLRPPLVHFPDNLSSGNLAGYYDRYMAAAHARRLDRLHAAGIRAAVHLDGTVRGLLPRLVRVGFDAIEALTPVPGGDLTPEEMASLAHSDTVILWGGVPGIMFAPPYTWADMEAHIRRLVRAWQGRPFVLGVADQVPPDGDIHFCRRIADLLEQI